MWNTPKHGVDGRLIDSIVPTPASRLEKKLAETPAGKRTVRSPLYEDRDIVEYVANDENEQELSKVEVSKDKSEVDGIEPIPSPKTMNYQMQSEQDISISHTAAFNDGFGMNSLQHLSDIHPKVLNSIAKAAEPPTFENIHNSSLQLYNEIDQIINDTVEVFFIK